MFKIGLDYDTKRMHRAVRNDDDDGHWMGPLLSVYLSRQRVNRKQQEKSFVATVRQNDIDGTVFAGAYFRHQLEKEH